MRTIVKLQILLLLAATPLLPAVVHADEAVVVGVNTYDFLPHANLKGCLNDVDSMKPALEKYHFHVTTLKEKDATCANILQKLKQMQTLCKPSDRFVFFFAGHGSKDGYLLPFGTTLTTDGTHIKGNNVLSAEKLHQAISAIPGRSHTVFLDACYAASMIKDLQINMNTRCVNLPVDAEEQPIITFRDALEDFYKKLKAKPLAGGKANPGQIPATPIPDNKPAPANDPTICYVTAAQATQPAAEMADPIAAAVHGLFTSNIVKQLDGQDKPWCEVQKNVSTAMSQQSKDAQKPQISPGFENTTIFENKSPVKPIAVGPRNVWDDYNEDHANKSKLQFAVTPARDYVMVEEKFDLTLTIGIEGYLVIIDRDQTGKIHLADPNDRDVEKIHVLPGVVSKKNCVCHLVGSERGRAILFSSRQRAKALIDSIPKEGLTLQESHAKELEVPDQSVYYSADIFLQVTPDAGA